MFLLLLRNLLLDMTEKLTNREPSNEQLRSWLAIIQGTKLLSYDRNDLAKTLNRPSVATGNSIVRGGKSRNSRNIDALKHDYKLLEDKAAELTDSGICRYENFYRLSDLVDDYVSVSDSYWVYLPKLKNAHPELFKPTTGCEKRADILAKIISGSLTEGAKEDIIVNFLRLNPLDISTYLCNYYASMGLLILMRCLLPCRQMNNDNRFRDSEKATEEAVSVGVILIRKLYQSINDTLNGSLASTVLYERVRKRGFYRLSLIYWFRYSFDDYVIKLCPDALEEYQRPYNERKFLFPQDNLLFKLEGEDSSSHFYSLERVVQDKLRPEKYYLYDCHYEVRNSVGHIRNERYELVFYRTGIVSVTSIKWLFNFITKEDNPLEYESQYDYKYNRRNGSLSLWVKNVGTNVKLPQMLKLIDASDKPKVLQFNDIPKDPPKSYQYIAGEGISIIAVMRQITDQGIFLYGSKEDETYFVRPNSKNRIDRLLPYLTIGDKVMLLQVKRSDDSIKKFLYLEKNGRYSFDISDVDKMGEYGVEKLPSSHSNNEH